MSTQDFSPTSALSPRPLSRDQLREVEAIFDRCLDAQAPDPRAWLAVNAPSDPAVCDRAARLLAAHYAASQHHPPMPDLAGRLANAARADIAAPSPESVGPYRIISVLGEGGFGVVYLAERREPMVQRVALKIIKPGMDSKAVIARFEQERQALAVMDHPNVARVFDAGTTPDGRPYFIMEHVAGEPITAFADRHNLSVRIRLELFVSVCEAVQHAHLKGIIHRDIKPSNILISVRDGRPLPKVIDFGVAKAISRTLTEKTIFTEHGQLIGTPEYMSPEQAEMGATDIDTRTDVYSLGVVLYELLSGLLPFDSRSLRGSGYEGIRLMLRDVEPLKPSTRLSSVDGPTGEQIARHRQAQREQLAKQLRHELDWIPLKAIRKDRTARYQSAADLARDVCNYLEGKPLDAGPESTAYRVRKLVRRNKGAVAAATAVLLTLVLGLAGTLWQAHRANERALAATNAEAEQKRLAESEAAARKIAEAKTAEAEAQRLRAQLAAETIERNAYVANVQMAASWLTQRQWARLRQRLDAAAETDIRGWEWWSLQTQSDPSLAELKGHSDLVLQASFSPDGARILTASADGSARIWDATAAIVTELKGHSRSVRSATFSRDGKWIVTASLDGTARVWDAATGETRAELRGHTRDVTSAAFSPDGTMIVTASDDGTARVWDAQTGANLSQLLGHAAPVTSAAFSPDGTRIVTSSGDSSARLWNASSGTSLLELKGHSDWVFSAVFSPDGKRVVTASSDNTARVWDAEFGASLFELKGHSSWVGVAAFSPDGTLIVTASDDSTARVWETATGASKAVLKGHMSWVRSAVFSPDGKRIVTASRDEAAMVWDARSGTSLARLMGHSKGVNSAAFSPDGTGIVTASADGTARVWTAETGPKAATLEGETSGIISAALSPDWTRIVSASLDNTARVWDASTGVRVAELGGHTNWVRAASFSPDGLRIATASRDDTARVWDAATGTLLTPLRGHSKGVTSATFSPDSKRIVTTSGDGTARVWDVTTGAGMAELKGHTSTVFSAAFSPDGKRIVTASWDDTARVWDAATGNFLVELRGHTNPVMSAAFSPDGTRVVTASLDDTARVWDATTGAYQTELKGHEGRVFSAVFSPDGTRIVTASLDGSARVWDSLSGSSLAELNEQASQFVLATFSDDGTRIMTVSADSTVMVWDCVPHRLRFAERAANARGENGYELIIRPWLRDHRPAGTVASAPSPATRQPTTR